MLSKKGATRSPSGRWSLSGRRRDYAGNVFNQQLYLIGRDVASKHGNLLVHYGCVREASPHPRMPSLYTLNFSPRRRLIFRGFGLFCGDDRLGGIFLRRREFLVEWTDEALPIRRPWIPDFLPRLQRPRTPEQRMASAKLLRQIVDRLIEYETWIEDRFGYPMRRGQLAYLQRSGRIVHTWHPGDAWREIRSWLDL